MTEICRVCVCEGGGVGWKLEFSEFYSLEML